MRTLLAIFALMHATPLVRGHAVLVEPPVRPGMGLEIPPGRKLVGETAFRDTPVNINDPNSGCGSTASTGNPGPGTPKVTWTAGGQAKVCWQTTIAHPEVPGTRSPGVRVSIAYTPAERFDVNVLLKDKDGGNTGTTYCQTVQVPAGKTCENCVLQWAWVSIPDGGAYLGCADVRIVAQPPACSSSLWLGTVGNCAQGNGLFDFSTIQNGHPGGPGAITRVCAAGTTAGNWLTASGSHGGYTTSLTTAKGDINYGAGVRRLGPAANCPQNAQAPPDLPPATPGNPPPQPPPNPVVPPPPPVATQPPATLPPDCSQGVGKCTCRVGSIKTALSNGLRVPLKYAVNVAIPMVGEQIVTIPCATANKGYAATTAAHTGFQVKCSGNTGKLDFGPLGGSCGAYPSCSSIAAVSATVCGTLPYDTSKANSPCSSSPCSQSDCCIGAVAPVAPVAPVGPNVGSCSTNCFSMASFSTTTQSCGMMQRLGSADLIPDGRCRQLQGGGTTVTYYQLTCTGTNANGVFGCNSPLCTQCSVNDFQITTNDINSCSSKPYLCGAGDPNSCGPASDFIFRTTCSAIDDATTWAASIFAGGAAAIMANV